jgi:thioredoxin reductase (NADPH)
LKRANLDVLILESNMAGGQMNLASTIENYPGFENISGPDLSEMMYNQMIKLGVSFENEEVINVINNNEEKIVKTKNNEYKCQNIIIAIGRLPLKLNAINEEKLVGRGISYCALCDGMFFKNKNVAIIGGGNSAFEEAIHMANIASHVTLIHRNELFKATASAIEKFKSLPNTTIITNKKVEEFLSENDKLSALRLKDTINSDETTMKIDGAFIFVGFGPNNNFVNNLNVHNNNNYIVVDENYKTNIDGIYAVGDVIDKKLYQIITAAAEGAIAAKSIINK